MHISLRNVGKSFGATSVLRNISADIDQGEFVSLLGPSGCGKTTLLRILAGLETLDYGTVFFDGFDAAQWSVQERRVGFVFQHYALFPHLSVFENVAFGLRMRSLANRVSKAALQKKVGNLLDLVQLETMAQRYPHQLSGGQKQRVAVARALAIEPRVLLLDEPFGALDVHVRQDLRVQLRLLQKKLGTTCILVTHDQDEALELSDRIILLNAGAIEQIGSPSQLYDNPKSLFAMNYLGTANRLPQPETDGRGMAPVYVRAHDIEILPCQDLQAVARIRTVILRGGLVQLELDTEDPAVEEPLRVEIPRARWDALKLDRGQLVSWKIKVYKSFQETAAVPHDPI